jgi:hypothetical protein
MDDGTPAEFNLGFTIVVYFVGPSPPTGTGTITFHPTFGSFTLLEPVFVVKVFRLFRLKQNFFGVQSVDTVGRCTTSYLLAGPSYL